MKNVLFILALCSAAPAFATVAGALQVRGTSLGTSEMDARMNAAQRAQPDADKICAPRKAVLDNIMAAQCTGYYSSRGYAIDCQFSFVCR